MPDLFPDAGDTAARLLEKFFVPRRMADIAIVTVMGDMLVIY